MIEKYTSVSRIVSFFLNFDLLLFMDDNDQDKNIIINNRIAECTASLASLVGETIKSLYSDIEDKIKKYYSKQLDELTVFYAIYFF